MENKTPVQQTDRNAANTSFNTGEQRVGRAGHDEKHDISHMDQQEGAMNNGTVGGNFSENDAEQEGGKEPNK
jgi:hypothetical protein